MLKFSALYESSRLNQYLDFSAIYSCSLCVSVSESLWTKAIGHTVSYSLARYSTSDSLCCTAPCQHSVVCHVDVGCGAEVQEWSCSAWA